MCVLGETERIGEQTAEADRYMPHIGGKLNYAELGVLIQTTQ